MSTSPLLVWIFISGSQLAVALFAKRRDQRISYYLLAQVAASLIGAVALLTHNSRAYYFAYCTAGLWTDITTAVLLIALLNDLRRRARAQRSGIFWPSISLLATLIFAINLSPLPRNATSSYWVTSHVFSHDMWLWLSIVLALTPLYSVVTMAIPDRNLLFKIGGTAFFIAVNAGLVDLLLTNMGPFQVLKTASDFFYLLSLVLWFTGLLGRSGRHPSSQTPELKQ